MTKILVPEDPNGCNSDIALIILRASVPSKQAEPVWVDVETDLAANPPAEVAMVSRGWIKSRLLPSQTGRQPQLVVVDDGKYQRRFMQNLPVLCVSDIAGTCNVPDPDEADGIFTSSTGMVLVDAPVMPADSGSGIIEQRSFAAGRPRLIAVATVGTIDERGFPQVTGAVRVDRHKDFLIAGGLEAATIARRTAPGWATGAPAPELSDDDAGGCAVSGGATQGASLPLAGVVIGLARRTRRRRLRRS